MIYEQLNINKEKQQERRYTYMVSFYIIFIDIFNSVEADCVY